MCTAYYVNNINWRILWEIVNFWVSVTEMTISFTRM